jgi:hypothetical protein
MLILRLPPYPLLVEYTVPDALTAYILVIQNIEEQSELEVSITSDATSVIQYSLTGELVKYDKSYALTVYIDMLDSGVDLVRGDIVIEDNLDISRPYINPATLATTATEIDQYTTDESLARAIIDSVTGGFYNKKKYMEVVGQGTDYIPLWGKTNKILKAYENSVLVYDSSLEAPAVGTTNYVIIADKSAITKDIVGNTGAINRLERRSAKMPLGASDSIGPFDTSDSQNVQTIMSGGCFPEGTDYVFLLETGYPVVPYDIQDATRMLINDIRCGKLDQYKRYVKDYETDQFKVEYFAQILDGTGNILVDKILKKYLQVMSRPRML